MLTLEMKTTEAYEAKNPINHMGQAELDFLSQAITKSPRRRSRICTHKSTQEKLHEMFVIYSDATFVRPNKHIGKDESVYVIRGACDFLFFDDDGKVIQTVEMGDEKSGKAYYCRVPQGVWHTLIIRSPEIVLFEGTPGPFNPAETVYADWGPLETDVEGVAKYRAFMDAEVKKRSQPLPRKLINLAKVNDLVLQATDKVVPFSEIENKYLQDKRRGEGLDRLRICAHPNGEDRLHEMLMTFAGTTYVRPSLHVDKEESLYILDGLGTYVFFDDKGNITDAVKLGPVGSGRSFYCRIPANTYHSLVVESPDILVKETTSGPFKRSDTVFADWCPDGTNQAEVDAYMTKLRAAMKDFG